MIADRKSFLYDMPTRTFYAALDPDFVGPAPPTIEIPRKGPSYPATLNAPDPYVVKFHLSWQRSTAVGFADIYESREPNSMPYYILLYKDADLMRQHWRIQRERSVGEHSRATAGDSVVGCVLVTNPAKTLAVNVNVW